MRKLILLLFGLTGLQNVTSGQVIESKNYLYLFSDSVIYGKTIEYKIPFLGSYYFLIDSRKIQPDTVMFYQNETGFFANTKKINFSGSSVFAERIRKGKINLYEKETTGMYMGGGVYTRTTNYYNKGFGELKKANYRNLSIDLADNTESMLCLNKFNSLRKTEITFYSIGAALFIGGFASLVNKTKDVDYDTDPHPNLTGNAIFLGAGVACLIVGATISFGKPKHIKSAIDKYNN